MLHASIYDLIKTKIASMEYAPGRCFSEIDLGNLGIAKNQVTEAFNLLTKDTLVHINSQQCTIICKLDLGNILDSIFIVRSILIALVKDLNLEHNENQVTILKLRQNLFLIENKPHLAEIDFFKADHHFYHTLAQLSGLPRLNKIILKEKLNIDRMLILHLGQQGNYSSLAKLYGKTLDGLLSGAPEKSIAALCSLASILNTHANKTVKDHPNLFEQHSTSR